MGIYLKINNPEAFGIVPAANILFEFFELNVVSGS